MSFCPNCGTNLEGNPLFCPECGAYLMNAAQGAATQQSAPQPQPQQPQPETYAQPQQQAQPIDEYYQPPVQQQQPQQQQYYQPPVQQQPQQQQYQQVPNYNTVPPQQQYGAPVYAPQVEDKVKIGLAILSFFIPLVGWILFFKKRKTTPKAARTYGIVATVSFVIGIISSRIGESAYANAPAASSIVCKAGENAPSYDGLFV